MSVNDGVNNRSKRDVINVVSAAKNENISSLNLMEYYGYLLSARRFVPYLQQYQNLVSRD